MGTGGPSLNQDDGGKAGNAQVLRGLESTTPSCHLIACREPLTACRPLNVECLTQRPSNPNGYRPLVHGAQHGFPQWSLYFQGLPKRLSAQRTEPPEGGSVWGFTATPHQAKQAVLLIAVAFICSRSTRSTRTCSHGRITRCTRITSRHHGRNCVFVHHLADCIFQQHDILVKRLNLPLQLYSIHQKDRNRNTLFTKRVEKRVL